MYLIQFCYGIVGVFLFLYGFFPFSEVLSNLENEPPIHINNISLNKEEMYTSTYTRSVLIVIDALRLDFVNKKEMPLTSRLVEQNGCFCKVKVGSPTVTLPCIKALTAGNVPQFKDIVLNLGSTEILKDSIIHSAHRSSKKIVFYGDNTWLKLFPDKFHRFEGTTSFFVKDFNEVDYNVTRNVYTELENNDWDIMILHYLGLDHIGHVYGPFSSLVPDKLNEMDNIVHIIHQNILTRSENILLIVTGDHGMRDSGGHGGSSCSETNVPFLIIGHHCQSSSFPQSDIPTNLAVLLGLRIPSTTIGRLRKEILPFDVKKYLYMLYYNTLLLRQKSSLGQHQFELANAHHEQYLKNSDEHSAHIAIRMYENCSEIISQSLMKTSSEQNFSCMIIALIIMFSILSILIMKIITPSKIPVRTNLIVTMFVSISLLKSYLLTLNYALILLIVILFILLVNWQSLKSRVKEVISHKNQTKVGDSVSRIISTRVQRNLTASITVKSLVQTMSKGLTHLGSFHSTTTIFLICVSLIQPLTFISSSFIEEEHQYWYFCYNIIILFRIINIMKKEITGDKLLSLCLLILFRILRKINSTGDMWANQPDISNWLLKHENHYYYQTFFIFELILLFFAQIILTKREANVHNHVANFVILALIFMYKNNDNIFLGRIIWIFIFCQFAFLSTAKIISWTLISCLMLKPYNVVLVSYCIFSSLFVSKHLVKEIDVVLFHSLLGNMLFFAQGHSNSLASVDISIGFIGLEEYHAIIVIAQVLCHTYIFPVLCHILILRRTKIDPSTIWNILFTFRLYTFFIVCIVTFIFRYHLFIWSVFAPKLFIESVHICFLFIEICYYHISKYLSSVASLQQKHTFL